MGLSRVDSGWSRRVWSFEGVYDGADLGQWMRNGWRLWFCLYGFEVKERLVVFFCFRKGEFVVSGAFDGDNEELSVKALLGVVAVGVKADMNYGFGGSWWFSG